MNRALPVNDILGTRIATISVTCPICNNQPESIERALFWCDFAKAAWWNSPRRLNSDLLQGTLREILQTVMKWPDQVFSSFVCLAWAIWRIRNDKVYEGQQPDMGTCARYYTETEQACRISDQATVTGHGPTVISEVGHQSTTTDDGYNCYVDGSWTPDGFAGVGIYITFRGSAVKWCSKRVRALSASQAEAKAVLHGCQLMQQYQYEGGQILSDCNEVVCSISQNHPVILDWRSSQDIWAAWTLLRQMGSSFRLSYCSRNNERLSIAHDLANLGRIRGWERMGSDQVPNVTDGS